jgi:branched-chain amino acid aminotransferase
MGSVAPHVAELDGSKFNITRSTNLRDVPLPGSPEELSHSYCTDHMVSVRWTAANGWETPEVKPYGNLSIPPTASVLHYATECFEGMKVYRGYDGKMRLFRPDCNGERLNTSAQRSSLPGFKYDELKKLVAKLMQIDGPRTCQPPPHSISMKLLLTSNRLVAQGATWFFPLSPPYRHW